MDHKFLKLTILIIIVLLFIITDAFAITQYYAWKWGILGEHYIKFKDGDAYPTHDGYIECFGDYPVGNNIGNSSQDLNVYGASGTAYDLESLFDTSGGNGTYYIVISTDYANETCATTANAVGWLEFERISASWWTLEEGVQYDYDDFAGPINFGIENYFFVWNEYNPNDESQVKFGIWFEYFNESYDWDQLILWVSSPSVNVTYNLLDDEGNRERGMALIYDSLQADDDIATEYEWWQEGTYTFNAYFYDTLEVESSSNFSWDMYVERENEQKTYSDWMEWNEEYISNIDNLEKLRTELLEAESALEETYRDPFGIKETLSTMKDTLLTKFPISWIHEIYTIWNEKRTEMASWSEGDDPLSLTWTVTGTGQDAFDGISLPLIDLTTAKSTYSNFFDAIRTTATYIIWITVTFVIINKTKRFIDQASFNND